MFDSIPSILDVNSIYVWKVSTGALDIIKQQIEEKNDDNVIV